MGMYDSYTTKCPKCDAELEIQSKSGECMLNNYTSKDLTPMVACGFDGVIIECQFCQTNFKVICNFLKPVKVEPVKVDLVKTKRKADYEGNYNSELPKNVKRIKEMRKILEKK